MNYHCADCNYTYCFRFLAIDQSVHLHVCSSWQLAKLATCRPKTKQNKRKSNAFAHNQIQILSRAGKYHRVCCSKFESQFEFALPANKEIAQQTKLANGFWPRQCPNKRTRTITQACAKRNCYAPLSSKLWSLRKALKVEIKIRLDCERIWIAWFLGKRVV